MTPAELEAHRAILATAFHEILRADGVNVPKPVIHASLDEILAGARVMLRSRAQCPTPRPMILVDGHAEPALIP